MIIFPNEQVLLYNNVILQLFLIPFVGLYFFCCRFQYLKIKIDHIRIDFTNEKLTK